MRITTERNTSMKNKTIQLRHLSLFLLFISVSYFANAQISIGIKGGVTSAWEFYNTELPENAEINVLGFNSAHFIRFWKKL